MKKISIIIPVFNERDTVAELLGKIHDLRLNGFEKEVIIVEDNSTDGTRDIVKAFYEGKLGYKLILSDAPRGKGYAVRMGLRSATGDIFAIQDADLEYDVSDYPKLLKPFMSDGANFVLGSRHLTEDGNTKHMIRKFHGKERFYAYMMNFGGVFLHKFFNILYGTDISDPTTMYKLFTRDLYEKVTLTGNYFELDWEIVSKFVRLGYLPVEIPVRYESRGLKAGKKVRLYRDVPKWLYMIISCRFAPIAHRKAPFTHLLEHERFGELMRYLLIGGSCAVLDLILLFSFVNYLHIWYLYAATASFIIVSTLGYFGQKYFSFRNYENNHGKQIPVFFVVAGIGLLINAAFMYAFVSLMGLWYILASVMTKFIVLIWNFFANKKITFRS
jgi:glycosyltransferase involved in cell wall biosynthesis